MELAIVIPVHNRAQLVKRTLDSVASQTYRPLHVVLVDNGSTDSTLDELQNWAQGHQAPDFRVDVIECATPGAPAARNAGLAAVEEEWTMFFDSDDVMLPTHVAEAMKCHAQHSKAAIIGWDVENVLLSGSKKILPFSCTDMIYDCIFEGAMATQRYMARTGLFRKAGGWREDVKVWNDIELGVRLLLLFERGVVGDWQIYKVNGRPTVQVFSQAQSITGVDYSTNGPEREHAIDVIEQDLEPGSKWMADLKRAILAAWYCREGKEQKAQLLMGQIKTVGLTGAFIKMAYAYTKKGGKGAAKIVRLFI